MRKTKIICTLGPATESAEVISSLIKGGSNLFRINMSHAEKEWTAEVVKKVREASSTLGMDVSIMMDLRGPSIRTGDINEDIQVSVGDRLELRDAELPAQEKYSLSTNYHELYQDLNEGDTLRIDNGMLETKVLSTSPGRVVCEVYNDAGLTSRRHINLPGIDVRLPALTEKDRSDIDLGVELGVDFFALSFARKGSHVHELRELLEAKGSVARVIAKIENHQSMNNLDDIILASDAVMVARGDLGIECEIEEMPIIQRKIIERCSYHGCKVIVATQMLESMIEQAVPTRAEVTDIFNAVIEHVDAVMLSGETSIGKYPLRCVEVLDRVCRRVEQEYPSGRFASEAPLKTDKHKTVKSATVLANSIEDSKLIVFTKRGVMAHLLAHQRPERAPIFAFSSEQHVCRSLNLARGVYPFLTEFYQDPEETIEPALKILHLRELIEEGEPLVLLSDVLQGEFVVDSILLRKA